MSEEQPRNIFVVGSAGDLECASCAAQEKANGAFVGGPYTFDDVYDGEPGGIRCDSCREDLTPNRNE